MEKLKEDFAAVAEEPEILQRMLAYQGARTALVDALVSRYGAAPERHLPAARVLDWARGLSSASLIVVAEAYLQEQEDQQ